MISKIFPELDDNALKTEKKPLKDLILWYLDDIHDQIHDILTYLKHEQRKPGCIYFVPDKNNGL